MEKLATNYAKLKERLKNKYNKKLDKQENDTDYSTNNYPNILESLDELPFLIESFLFCNDKDIFSKFYITNEERRFFVLVKATLKVSKEKIIVTIFSDLCDQDQYRDRIFILRNKAKEEHDQPTYTYVVRQSVLSEILHSLDTDKNYENEELILRFDTQIKEAIAMKVTDIHYRVGKSQARVEYRLHGEIQYYTNLSSELCTSMIRALYNAKGSEGQKDQQFNPKSRQQTIIERYINGKKYRLRFASAPVESSEMNTSQNEAIDEFIVSFRILSTDKSAIPNLDVLGYNKYQKQLLESSLMIKDGAIIFAGTTGSGKSTSLASLIYKLISNSKNKIRILSVESPVEYIINGVSQLIVHESANMTEEQISLEYNNALKTLMRLDPDVMMCNEIRNQNTGDFFQKGVQSGHLMLTTVHAQSTLQIAKRLIAIGMDRDVVLTTSFAKLLIYQRLVPMTCKKCAITASEFKEFEPDKYEYISEALDNIISYYGLSESILDKVRYRNPNGCESCSGLGISGRNVVAEVLQPDEQIMQYLEDNAILKAREHWLKNLNGVTIIEHGLQKVFDGDVCPWVLHGTVGSFEQDFSIGIKNTKWLYAKQA
ncbi:ATPase, T2SS/T4P/T4SS family [Francisella sp. 19X1-34]|uniref:GspE/PulE family protein n=1 Tax=Francisella sp. 19X1-34 TaxID=3087177 RepID=UPI002E37F6CB|nr:ATPase, T2SS/T4P/T4SS family [Francisella sp. 19X1-34]MED7788491.1 ATPase, T2SS/T4P/T4SS family [Francisella sp. 19X1-34]